MTRSTFALLAGLLLSGGLTPAAAQSFVLDVPSADRPALTALLGRLEKGQDINR